MSDLLDRPLHLPPYPSHGVPADGVPLNRRQRRLRMAYHLFCSLVSGSWQQAVGPGNSTGKIRQWCWEQADAFLAEGDEPPQPAGGVRLGGQEDAA